MISRENKKPGSPHHAGAIPGSGLEDRGPLLGLLIQMIFLCQAEQ
jgi:hypothetical protein